VSSMENQQPVAGNEGAVKPALSFFLFGKSNEAGYGDKVFRGITGFFAFLILILAVLTFTALFVNSLPSIKAIGWKFLVSSEWDPIKQVFGAVPYVYGTLVSSFLSLLIAVPLGLGIALFLTELAPLNLRAPVAFVVDILAAIPSVVYGLWGMFVLAPIMARYVNPVLAKVIGGPLFVNTSIGLSFFTAGVILSIMILPTIISISRDVFEAVPNVYRESAKALGATDWETIQLSVLRASKPGVVGAVMLGLGRALGETMAVTMVIGNNAQVTANLLAPGHSMASVIANEFTEATGDVYLAALSEIGLLLMVITFFLNIGAHLLVWFTTRNYGRN
jgi:phosphate transport system permease protein